MEFKPTWLYIKQHNITGLKYFGKTVADPQKYKGSGTYWKKHLKMHTDDVTTIWCKLFTVKQDLIDYALNFSVANNIVESIEWANLIPESGEDGGARPGQKGHAQTEQTKAKIRAARMLQKDPRLGKRHSNETKEKIKQKRAAQVISEESKLKRSEKMKGYVFSDERNQAISTKLKGRKFSAETIEKMKIAAKLRCAKRRGEHHQ